MEIQEAEIAEIERDLKQRGGALAEEITETVIGFFEKDKIELSVCGFGLSHVVGAFASQAPNPHDFLSTLNHVVRDVIRTAHIKTCPDCQRAMEHPASPDNPTSEDLQAKTARLIDAFGSAMEHFAVKEGDDVEEVVLGIALANVVGYVLSKSENPGQFFANFIQSVSGAANMNGVPLVFHSVEKTPGAEGTVH